MKLTPATLDALIWLLKEIISLLLKTKNENKKNGKKEMDDEDN